MFKGCFISQKIELYKNMDLDFDEMMRDAEEADALDLADS